MTWNFAILAMDQIFNSAAKMRYMSGGQFRCPIIFRGPDGRRAAAGRAALAGAGEPGTRTIPGVKVVVPGTPADAKGLLKAAIRDDDPVCVFEGEMLYNLKGEVPEDDDFVIPLGVADLKREGGDVSIITHGKMIHVALQAAAKLEKDGIQADVLDLRSLRPLDTDAILATVREDQPRGAAGGGLAVRRHQARTIAAMIQEEAFDHARRAGAARDAGRRADAVRQGAGEGREAERRAGGRKGEPGAVPIVHGARVRDAPGSSLRTFALAWHLRTRHF